MSTAAPKPLPASARRLVAVLMGAIAVEAAVALLSLGSLADGHLDMDHYAPSPYFELPVFLAGGVLWLMWQYGAHARLARVSKQTLRFSPGWGVGWWFVPFANLVQPFRAMSELVTASESDARSGAKPGFSAWILPAWWACYLGGNILSRIAALVVAFGDADDALLWMALGAGALCAAGVFAIMTVREVEARLAVIEPVSTQPDGAWLAEALGGSAVGAVAGGAVWVFALLGIERFDVVSLHYDFAGAAVCAVVAAVVGVLSGLLTRTLAGRQGMLVAAIAAVGASAAILIGQNVLADMSTRFGRAIDDLDIPMVSSAAVFVAIAVAAAIPLAIAAIPVSLPGELPRDTDASSPAQ